MNNALLILILTLSMGMFSNVSATTISQCKQPDGTIEFSNQGCSKSNSLNSKRTFRRNFTQSYVTNLRKNSRKGAPFRQADFVALQNKMLAAQNLQEMQKHAQTIIAKVRTSAQKGKLNAAFNMVAATYAKVSKEMKKKQWKGQSVNRHTFKVLTLFEDILITQSTTSTASELNQTIQSAWENYQAST